MQTSFMTSVYLVSLAMLCYKVPVTRSVGVVDVTVNQIHIAHRLRHFDCAG